MNGFFKKVKDHIYYVIKGDPDENAIKADTIPVLMQDGAIEQYDPNFVITDHINCMVCSSKYYHTRFDCLFFRSEIIGNQARAMYIKDAIKQGYNTCNNCFEMSEDDYRKGNI